MTVLCADGVRGVLVLYCVVLFFLPKKKHVQTAFGFSTPIILLPLPISLLLTFHDSSPACKIYALFYNVSHALKQVLSQAVTRAGGSNLPPISTAIM